MVSNFVFSCFLCVFLVFSFVSVFLKKILVHLFYLPVCFQKREREKKVCRMSGWAGSGRSQTRGNLNRLYRMKNFCNKNKEHEHHFISFFKITG